MFKVLTLNPIAKAGLERLPGTRYELTSEAERPDAILVRSHDMHELPIADSVLAVARAGAGVNNIPIGDLTERGIPVFNTPGANANAVKELVLAGMLLAARNLYPAIAYLRELRETGPELKRRIEAGKRTYVGVELPGRTLGVLGLGAIGVRVANAARSLGMRVLGFDPAMTVENRWELSADVEQVESPDELLARSDFVTLHVPLNDATRGWMNAARIRAMLPGGVLLNFARGEIVDTDAVLSALGEEHLRVYVTDFPEAAFRDHARVIALPHLGASTREAEQNCAVMVAEQLRGFLEHGTIQNAVNFPSTDMPRARGCRMSIVNRNIPNMVGRITTAIGDHGHNILDLLNKSRGDVAYTLVDVEEGVAVSVLDAIRAVDGVLSVRVLPGP